MSSHPDSSGLTPADLSSIASYPTHPDAHDRGLVALSMGIPYWVFASGDRYHLLVETEFHAEVAPEVHAYDQEIAHPHPAGDPHHSRTSPATIALVYAYCLVLSAAFLFQKATEPWSVETFGNDNIALFEAGEYYRPATALFLHGDLAHLLGNLAFGAWFILYAARALGAPLATLAILLGGVLGNTLAAAIYHPDHHITIGASTAVFAALGVLVGNGLFDSLRNHSLVGLSTKLAPLGGGLALLALTGAGDATSPGTTDILAHLCGFALGIPLGLAATAVATADQKA